MTVALEMSRSPLKLNSGRFTLELGKKTHVMGVLNRTPDSFSDGGKFMDEKAAILRIQEMVREGADIIDVGGESTRPGSKGVGLREELERTIPLIEKMSVELEVPISIDTSKHEVARLAIQMGAAIVNDISGLKADPKMAGVISESGAAVCIMHTKGTPENMQDNPLYDEVMTEIIHGLSESIDIAEKAGIPPDKIIVDPGIGFGKTVLHNLIIVNRLAELKVLDKPILIGTSRKSFIGAVLNKAVCDRLMGTAVTSALAIRGGASIIRVHDVREMVEVARMTDAVKTQKTEE